MSNRYQKFSKESKGHRSYDAESGMNRTRAPRRAPPPKEESSDDDHFSDSEVDQFVGAKHRDDTLRPKTTVIKGSKYRGRPEQEKIAPVEATQKDVEVVEPKEPTFGSSGALLLLSMSRAVQPSPRVFKAPNSYIPDSANMFEAVNAMTKVLTDNLRLYERVPDYSSIALNLYYSHVYFYQILRARDQIGVLTRFERRSLRIYETIGKPEAWPVAQPLSGFIQALGSCQLDNKMFSIVAPAFPDFSKFTERKGLHGMSSIHGIGRVPIVPAYHKFLRNFAEQTAAYVPGSLSYVPVATPLSTSRQFVGLDASLNASQDFQILAFNSAWNQAIETEEPVGFQSRGGIQTRIARWVIPDVSNDADFSSGMENFLFIDQNNTMWMHNLLRVATAVNEFFPSSANLGAIPPTTVAETYLQVDYTTNDSSHRATATDEWYQTRKGWSVTAYPKTYGDEVNPLTKMGVATSTRSSYDENVIPSSISNAFEPRSTGPYFVNQTGYQTVPITQADIVQALDPTTGIQELIFSLYNNNPN